MPVKNPTKAQKRRWNLSARYGLTPDEISSMLEAQKDGCAICETALSNKNMRIDHNHYTGRVRGLLCHECNIKLPIVEECGWMMLAWAYLDEND